MAAALLEKRAKAAAQIIVESSLPDSKDIYMVAYRKRAIKNIQTFSLHATFLPLCSQAGGGRASVKDQQAEEQLLLRCSKTVGAGSVLQFSHHSPP